MMSRVILSDSSYAAIGDLLPELFEKFDIDVMGKRVLLKPNLLTPTTPDKGNTTHPRLVEEVVRYVEDKADAVWVGDNPGGAGYGSNERVAEITGVMDAASGHYVNLGTETVQVDAGRELGQVVISKKVLEADVVINLPKFKTHVQTVITGGIKNMYGIIVGADKARLHRISSSPAQFSKIIVDIYKIRPPDLTIMDAVVGMEGNGPSNGALIEINKVIASDNAVSLDAVMAAMMGLAPESVPLLNYAYEEGLGEVDIQKIDIEGILEQIPNFKLGINFSKGVIGNLINKLAYIPFVRTKLKVATSKCTGCGVCVKSCPVEAIELGEQYAQIDRSECIRCYCCKEVCIYDAVQLGGLLDTIRRFWP